MARKPASKKQDELTPDEINQVSESINDIVTDIPTPTGETKPEVVQTSNLTIKAKDVETLATVINEEITLDGFVKRKYNLEPEQYPGRLKHVIKALNDYIKNMSYNVHVSIKEGFNYQMSLLRTIKMALDNRDISEAHMCYDVILFAVSRNIDTTFTERLALRFVDNFNEVDYNSFTLLMNVILSTAVPTTRAKGLQSINMQLTAERLRNETLSMNLLSYYASQL